MPTVVRPLAGSMAIALVAILSVNCGGSVPLDGKACPCVDGYVCCAENTCVPPGHACPRDGKGGAGLVVAPKNILALCDAPHGPPLTAPRTGAAMTRVMTRRWFVCGYDPNSWSPLFAFAGIEFRADGTWAHIMLAADGTYSVQPQPEGTWGVFNDMLDKVVGTTDTTTGDTLHIRWFNDKLGSFHGPFLDLKTDFEKMPFRWRTEKAIPHWFVALDESGVEVEGHDGMACAEGSFCAPPSRCVYERNVTVCNAPATVQRGEGCDRVGTRTCAPGLTCLDTRQCGDAP